MRHRFRWILPLFMILCLSISGVFASWQYAGFPDPVENGVVVSSGSFKYGLLYITETNATGASVSKTADTAISVNSSGAATVQVTVYNSTSVSYYYDETFADTAADFTVSGIMQQDEVPPGTYKTFSVNVDGITNTQLNFKFTVDKDSIGDIVANTAVDRFGDILNNVVESDSYSQLTTAMDNRGGWNKGSAVTYIGNVAGADSGDSATINALFDQEFMSMDLDGDGTPEPVTMIIKREDVDNNTGTGDSYSYSSWTGTTTVNGAEMTLYITAHDFSNTGSNSKVVVYAASFTKLPGATAWTPLIPLTKGTATANNYSGGWGGADSFNTDTWRSDNNLTIRDLVE